MKFTIKAGLVLAFGTVSLAACGGAADETAPADVAETEAPVVAAEVARLECEPLGDVSVWVETQEGGENTLVTHMQSEQEPDAEPNRMALEATGMSAGREGTRYADASAEYVVWMMDDGTATVNTGELSVNCKA